MITDTPVAAEVGHSRWHVTIFYYYYAGIVGTTHDLAEIEDLQNLLERVPHAEAIKEIYVARVLPASAALTAEEAARL